MWSFSFNVDAKQNHDNFRLATKTKNLKFSTTNLHKMKGPKKAMDECLSKQQRDF